MSRTVGFYKPCRARMFRQCVLAGNLDRILKLHQSQHKARQRASELIARLTETSKNLNDKPAPVRVRCRNRRVTLPPRRFVLGYPVVSEQDFKPAREEHNDLIAADRLEDISKNPCSLDQSRVLHSEFQSKSTKKPETVRDHCVQNFDNEIAAEERKQLTADCEEPKLKSIEKSEISLQKSKISIPDSKPTIDVKKQIIHKTFRLRKKVNQSRKTASIKQGKISKKKLPQHQFPVLKPIRYISYRVLNPERGFCKPCVPGFVRYVTMRKRESAGCHRFDVYYTTPNGKNLRSKPDCVKYLSENPTSGLKYDQFDYSFKPFNNMQIAKVCIANRKTQAANAQQTVALSKHCQATEEALTLKALNISMERCDNLLNDYGLVIQF